jgi:hypothetical protein
VGRALQKIQCEQIERAVIIPPIWPRQPWFLLLLEMTIDQPIYLPQSNNLLQSPLETTHPLLVARESTTLRRVASVRIPYKNKEFLKKQQTSFAHPGGRVQKSLTLQHGTSGAYSWCEEQGKNSFSASSYSRYC